MAGDEKIQLDITAKDDASDTIDDVATAAENLEKLSPEVEIKASDQATGDIDAVTAAADHLARLDTELVIKAQIDQAKGQLRELQDSLDDTGKHARDATEQLDKVDGGGGSGLRGNAIADLTGPLGDASSAASDFAGVFDGLGDAAEAAAGKLGLSEDVAGKVSSAIGGLGVAVAAGAAIWSLWTAHQQAAKKAAEENAKAVVELGDAIVKGDRAAQVTTFHKMFDEAIKKAGEFGLKTEDVTRFITGQSDAIPGLTTHYQELKAAREAAYTDEQKAKADAALTAFEDEAAQLDINKQKFKDAAGASLDKAAADDHLADMISGTTGKQKDMNRAVDDSIGKLDAAEQKTRDLEAGYGSLADRLSNKRAIEDWQAAMVDAQTKVRDGVDLTRDDIRGIEDDIEAAGKAAGLTPIEIQAEIDRVDQGDIDGAYLDMQQRIDAKGPLNATLKIHPELPPRLKIVTRGGTTILDEALVPISSSASAPQVVNNINMPAGSRGVDVVRQVSGQARRSGRRYGAQVVNYARR